MSGEEPESVKDHLTDALNEIETAEREEAEIAVASASIEPSIASEQAEQAQQSADTAGLIAETACDEAAAASQTAEESQAASVTAAEVAMATAADVESVREQLVELRRYVDEKTAPPAQPEFEEVSVDGDSGTGNGDTGATGEETGNGAPEKHSGRPNQARRFRR